MFMVVLLVLQTWGVKHLRSFGFFFNITISEIHTVVVTDITVTTARESGEVTDFVCHVPGDVAYAVTISGEYLDGIRVVFVGWLRLQGGNELTQVVVYMFAVGDACNVEFDVVYTLKSLILGPDADVVAFVLDAEVTETLNTGFVNGMRSRCPRTVI